VKRKKREEEIQAEREKERRSERGGRESEGRGK
jgi:hypothetical protein